MHRTGLPLEPDYFVNREQELETIMQNVTGNVSHRARIITITGSPGHGKTTLANVCCHRFVSQGIPVRYVDLQDVCTIKGIIVKILYAVGWTVPDPSMEQLSMWARQRQNGVLVLMLDNVDCFTLSGDGLKKEFTRLIKDFIVKPSLAIHVILTTQYHLSYIERFQVVPLGRLSETHAKELLLFRNPSLTANVTTTLVYLTDGNPLALQILSALLNMPNAPPIQTLLKQVHFDPVKALSPDSMHEKLNHVLEVAISYLSDADHQCFLVVCQFPSSFDEASATVVLSHFVNESESTCLGHLQDRSLLEYNKNSQRYAVIPLLKAFVNSTSQQFKEMVSQFFPVYAEHLLHTAVMKQLRSEVHLQNYLKANYLGVQYLMNGYVSWSNNALTFDANLDLVLPFALSTFEILPLLQPVDAVERFWLSVQRLAWNISSEGLEGQCHDHLEQAIEFESLLADYMLSTGKNNTVEAARLSRRAQSIQFDKLQLLITSNCTKTITLLRYLGHVAKCIQDEAVYLNLLQTICRLQLASNKTTSTTDADYNMGVIYFDLNEYSLAVEFLNRSLTGKPGIQQIHAAKTMVLAFQRSGQHKVAMDTVTWLVPYLLKQVTVDISTSAQQSPSVFTKHFNARSLSHEPFYDELAQSYLEELYIFAERCFAILDLPVVVNNTALSWSLLQNISDRYVKRSKDINIDFTSSSMQCEYYSSKSSEDPLFQMLRNACLECNKSNTRRMLWLMQFHLYKTRVICDYSKAFMKVMMNAQNLYSSEAAQEKFREITQLFSELVDREHYMKRMQSCNLYGTDSVECQISRGQVQLLWQMQYELADGLAVFFGSFGMLEQAKNYTEIALEKLPQSAVKKKWKVMVNHKLSLAMIELSLGNYWNAVYILHNCSLTIDKEIMETVYQTAQHSTTWQSHDLSFPESQFSVLANHYGFNASNMLCVVVSVTIKLISHEGIVITGSQLLFVAIMAVLWSLLFMTLSILGSLLYCFQFFCSCCSDRHNCLSNIILYYLFDVITLMFAFSHVVVYYTYVLHFHTAILLTYLNYM